MSHIVQWALVPLLALGGTATGRDTSVETARLLLRGVDAGPAEVAAALNAWVRPPETGHSSCLQPIADPRGYWVGGSDPGGCVHVRQRADGTLLVRLVDESHDGTVAYRRLGSMAEPWLGMAGPVLTTTGHVFDRFLAVEVNDRELLIPESSIPEVNAHFVKSGCSVLPMEHVVSTLYERASVDGESTCRWLLGQKERGK